MTHPGDEMTERPDTLWLAEVWQENRERIARLLSARMPDALLRRMGVDDMLQEVYLACGRRMNFLRESGELPLYVKMRRVALQTLADMERKHLAAGKRDVLKEVDLMPTNSDRTDYTDAWAQFADTISSPRTHLERMERQATTRRVLQQLPKNDREILELRHFEELSNTECAAVLEITQKTASIRYVRALKRFRDLLLQEDERL